MPNRASLPKPLRIRNLVPALEKARAYRGRGGEVIRQAACRDLGCGDVFFNGGPSLGGSSHLVSG